MPLDLWRVRSLGWILAGIWGAGLLAGCQDQPQVQISPRLAPPASPQQLLSKMVEVYQRARSYADTGSLYVRVIEQGQERTLEPVPLSVAVERPNKLRLHAYQTSVVCDGAKLWASITEIAGQVLVQRAPERLSLADLTGDKILAASLGGGIDFEPPQLRLLLEADPLASARAGEAKLLAEREIEGRKCLGVELVDERGATTYWIDGESHLLRRVDLPTKQLRKQIDPEGRASGVEVWIELTAAQVDRPIPAGAFQFEVPRGVSLLQRFLEPPPAPPAPLLGQTPGEFAFVDLEGNAVDPASLAGKVVVLDMWATWCHWCFKGFPHLQAVYQKYQDHPDVRILAVSRDEPAVPNEQLQQSFTRAGVQLPIVRDLEDHGSRLFQVQGLPTTIVLGRNGTVQDVEVGYNPRLAEELPAKLEKLLAGTDLAAEALQSYRERQAAYEKERAAALVTASTEVEIPRAQVAPPAKPRAIRLEPLWSLAEVKQPGNLLATTDADGQTRIFVCAEGRQVAELSPGGRLTAEHDLQLPEATAATYLRTGVDRQGRRYFAAFASGQQQLHVYDAQWQKVLSYPSAEVGEHAGIGDVQLADLDGDGSLEIGVGYWGQVGAQGVALDGRRLWSNRALEYVLRVAVTDADAGGRRFLLCSNGRGTLIPLDASGQPGQEIRLANRPLHTVVAGGTEGGASQYCGLSSEQDGATTAVGLALTGEERWRYPLPVGIHTQPVEIVSAGRVLAEGPGQWLLAGPDGSVHLLGFDGKLIDRFNTGKLLTGLGTAEIEGQPALLVVHPDGITAWRVARAK